MQIADVREEVSGDGVRVSYTALPFRVRVMLGKKETPPSVGWGRGERGTPRIRSPAPE